MNPDINQLFIDNLNAKLKDIFDKTVINIMNNEDELKYLDKEFKKALKNFVDKGSIEKKFFQKVL